MERRPWWNPAGFMFRIDPIPKEGDTPSESHLKIRGAGAGARPAGAVVLGMPVNMLRKVPGCSSSPHTEKARQVKN